MGLGEVGVGEMGQTVGKMGKGEMGVGKMRVNRCTAVLLTTYEKITQTSKTRLQINIKIGKNS